MRAELTKTNQEMKVKLHERLAFSDHTKFRELLTSIDREQPTHCVFDLSELISIDSAGLGMLMIAHQQSEKSGWKLSLQAPKGHVKQLLELSRFDKIIPITC